MFDEEIVDDGVNDGNEGRSEGTNEGDIFKDIKINKNQKRMLIEIDKNNSITQKELASLLSVSESTIQRNSKKLQEEGLLERVGPTKSGYWVVKK